jgi:hypothetical protein
MLKVNLPRCQDCGMTCQPDQIFRLVFRKKKLYIDLCPKCYKKHYDRHIKEMNITLEQMVKSGMYKHGARTIDFKEYLLQWVKNQKDRV